MIEQMSAYFEYLREIFKQVLEDLGVFFTKAIVSPWTDVDENFAYYTSTHNA